MTARNRSSHVSVVCHAWYRDVIGGSFRLASEFAEYLAEQGYPVSYICCAPDDQAPPESVEAGVHIYRYMPPPKSAGRLKKLSYHIQRTRSLLGRIHASHPISVISSHSPLQGLGAARAFRGEHVLVNYTVHSPFDSEVESNHLAPSGKLKQFIARKIARWIDRENVRAATIVQTDSEFTQLDFRNKFGKLMDGKGVTVPGWVKAEAFRPAIDRAGLKGQLGSIWQTDRTTFFTLRRLESRMGLDTLIEASRILKNRGYCFRTIIGGSGSLKEELQRQIAFGHLGHEVFLLGRMAEDQVPLAYAAADCFVLPTRALECFGLIVLEAFACKTPVIAANVAAIPELAGRQGPGWMFEPGNASELADRMQAVIEQRLKPTTDLRQIAMEYDKPKVLKAWESTLLALQDNSSTL